MKDKDRLCLRCTLSICDELAPECLYRIETGTNVKARKNATKVRNNIRQINARRSAIAAMGFGKYDKRRRPGTTETQRTLWRIYKQQRNEICQQDTQR